MSMMVSFVLSFFPRDVLDEILNLIESVSEDFPSYSFRVTVLNSRADSRVVANVDGRTDVRVEFCKNVAELWSLFCPY